MRVEDKQRLLWRLGLKGTATAWTKKFRALKGNTASEEYKCLLDFTEYVTLAFEAGLTSPEQIGRTRGSYQMARLKDIGNYEVGNCRFILQSQNISEKSENGGTARAAEKKTGRTKASCPGLASAAAKMSLIMRGCTKATRPGTAVQADKLSKHFRLTYDGQIYIGKNLLEFCRLHVIKSPSCMSRVCNGKKAAYKGWTGTYMTEEQYFAETSINSTGT